MNRKSGFSLFRILSKCIACALAIATSACQFPSLPSQEVSRAEVVGPRGIRVQRGYRVDDVLSPQIVAPTDLGIGPNGDIFIVEWDGQRIVRVSDSGEVSTLAEVDLTVPTLAVSPKGDVFAPQRKGILRITPDGEKSTFASGTSVARLAFSPSGDLVATSGSNLFLFSPAGERSLITAKLPSGNSDMAVSPSGEVFIAYHPEGKILKVDRQGAVSTVADGFWYDAFNIEFDREGNLYANQDALSIVSPIDGSRFLVDAATLPRLNSRPFAFDPAGNIVFIGPTDNTVISASADGTNLTCLVDGIGNSSALAVGPTGDLFIGASNCYPALPGKILKVNLDGSTSEFLAGLAFVWDIAFGSNGQMYVSEFDYPRGPGRLLEVSPEGTITTIFSRAGWEMKSIAVSPLSKEIYAYDATNEMLVRIAPGEQSGREGVVGWANEVPADFGAAVQTVDITFDRDGNLICLVAFEENYDTGPVHRGLFKITPANNVTLLAEIDTPLATSEDDVCVSPTGQIIVVGPERHPAFRLLMVTPQGDVSTVARNIPFDTLAVTTNDQGDVFFTCSAGLFKLSRD